MFDGSLSLTPPSGVHFVEWNATPSRFPQAPSCFPSSRHTEKPPYQCLKVLPPQTHTLLRSTSWNGMQLPAAFRKLQAAFRNLGMPTMYAHVEILVAFLVVRLFSFLVITFPGDGVTSWKIVRMTPLVILYLPKPIRTRNIGNGPWFLLAPKFSRNNRQIILVRFDIVAYGLT